MGSRLSKANEKLLWLLDEAPDGVLYLSEDKVKALVKKGFVEQHQGMVDVDGNFATRLSQSGIDEIESMRGDEEVIEAPAEESVEVVEEEPEAKEEPEAEEGFQLESGIEIPEVSKRPRGSYKYPFEKMEVGHSFHVPATEDRPKPSRTLASTASTASKRLEKLFRVRTVREDDPKGAGARVFRIK